MYDVPSALKLVYFQSKEKTKIGNFMHCICPKKSTFVSVMHKQLEEVYIKVIDEFVSNDSGEFKEMQAVYRRSCLKFKTVIRIVLYLRVRKLLT